MAGIVELDLGGLALAGNRPSRGVGTLPHGCSDRPDGSAVTLPVSAVEQSGSLGCYLISDTLVSHKYTHGERLRPSV